MNFIINDKAQRAYDKTLAKHVLYSKGFKYRLKKECKVKLEIKVQGFSAEFVELDNNGVLTIKAGYAWGALDGPNIRSRGLIRASLIHDALYQAIREGFLSISLRDFADKTLRRICREDGTGAIKAWYLYHLLKRYGKKHPIPGGYAPVKAAP